MSEWQPIETAPEKGPTILVYFGTLPDNWQEVWSPTHLQSQLERKRMEEAGKVKPFPPFICAALACAVPNP